MKISKSPRKFLSDKKEYELLTLENGLKVLLVNDGNEISSNVAAVALCVGSGSFNDPKNVQGLSHFLEHMIFMGSAKYPKENELDQFVSSHGGYDNAYTDCEHTLFHFDINAEHLEGALDRFAQLFIAPIMSIDSMEREMESVESEFQLNSSDDEVRVDQIFCTMINDDHPTSNFIWGNSRTLKDEIDREKLYQRLHEFRRANYVADQMFLCIQSSRPTEDLEEIVVKYFSDIQSHFDEQNTTKPKHTEMFKSCFCNKIFFVKSTTNKSKLLMTFQLPPIDKDRRFLEYLVLLIESEGAGSLTDFFMNESLAVRVKAKFGYQSFEGNSFFTFFTIEINLTTNGLISLERVLEPVFSFLLLIKSTPLTEHEKRYNEFKSIKETLFRYRKEKPSIENVQELAVNMRYFKDEDVIIGNEICPDFNEKAVKDLIERINERKFNLLILSDKHQKYDKFEKWFGTEYAEVDFPQIFEKLWSDRWLIKGLTLPKPNDFVCSDFEIIADHSTSELIEKYPEKILDSPSCECFYKLDGKFRLPHGFVNVFLSSPVTSSSVTCLNLTSIFSMCAKNFLSEKLYSATMIGYNYKINSVDNGLILKLNGFNEKLPLILGIILDTIRTVDTLVDRTVFDSFKKELRKNCRNCLNDGSLLNDDCRLGITKKHHRLFYERIKNISSLNFSTFKDFCRDFLGSLKAKILIQGNVSKATAIQMSEIITRNLNLLESEMDKTSNEVLQIPVGTSCLEVKSFRADHNSVTKNFYQIGKASIKVETLTQLIVNLINEPLFEALRSQAQLGYGVACSMRKNAGAVGILITVEFQTNKNSAEFIDRKIQEFLNNFYGILNQMEKEEIEMVKCSLSLTKLNQDAELETEVERNWDEIKSGENIFNRSELESTELERINNIEIVEFYRKIFLSEETMRKLSIRVIGNGSQVANFEQFPIEEIEILKCKLTNVDQ